MDDNILDQKWSAGSLLHFAFPTIVMMIFMGLYTIVDTIFVAQFVNTDALSSINIVCPVINISVGLGTMIATGGNAIVSRKMGAGKNQEAKEDFTLLIITVPQSNGKTPGIMNWVVLLKWKEVLENNFIIHFRTVGAKYGDKDFFIEDILEDHLDFHISLLEEGGKLWDKLIQDKIAQTEKAAWFLGVLAEELFKAAGGQPDSDAEKGRIYQASQMYYSAVDIPFRRWLASIDPDLGDAEELRAKKDEQWRMEAYHLAMKQGQKMVQNAGEAAFAGRWVEGKFYSSPNAFNRFFWQIRDHFNIKSITKEKTDERP